MTRLFGTDGVRGIANRDLSPELAFKLGEAGARFLAPHGGRIIIGRDTRHSGDMLQSAMVAGIGAAGVDAVLLGVVPTPAVSFLTTELVAAGGAVISASHNPAEYNGIKFFDANGIKLSEEKEDEIENILDSGGYRRPEAAAIGRLSDGSALARKYIDHAVATIDGDLRGMKVAIDCANGANYVVAPAILERLGAELFIFADEPDGDNINRNCGSTDPGRLTELVREVGADVGLAFDGDGDRVIAVDEQSKLVDGDFIMAISAIHLDELGLLRPKAIVTTVMTNLGFRQAMAAKGIKVLETSVGDRYVLQEMLEHGVMVGGEQSGHIIYLKHGSTGDGIITGLQLLAVLRDSGKPLSELRQVMRRLPQALLNVRVEGHDKRSILESPKVMEAIRHSQLQLGESGRLLVRPSGTEPLIRVMAEADTEDAADDVARTIAGVIEGEL